MVCKMKKPPKGGFFCLKLLIEKIYVLLNYFCDIYLMNNKLEAINLDEIFLSIWATQEGLSIEEYKIKEAERKDLNDQSKKYVNLSPDKWPQLFFNWDLKLESQIYSFHNTKNIEEIEMFHLGGLLIFSAKLIEIDSFLNPYSKRTESEIWEVGCVDKLARAIVHLSNEKNCISPPMIIMNEAGITLTDGNHRYTAAKFSNQERIFMYTTHEYVEELDNLLKSIEWLSIE